MGCSIGMALAKQKASEMRKKKWVGGDIYDNIGENSHPKVTSGEPHTEGYEEEKHPMEFMADGGIVDEPAYKYEGSKKPIVDVEGEPKKMGASAAPEAGEMDGYDADSEPVQYMKAGGMAKTEEKRRFQVAAKMLDGGEVIEQPRRPGIGKGGGLKGAFEHEAETPKLEKPKDKIPESYGYEKDFAGGTAGEKEDYSLEEKPRFMAGGEAALPEDRQLQQDPGVDPDASFVAEFLKARKARAAAPGR